VKIRSFVAWAARGVTPPPVRSPTDLAASTWREARLGSLNVRYELRERLGVVDASGRESETLVLGDDSEWHPGDPSAVLAGGVPIQPDASTHAVRLTTSLVGLPPVFVYRGTGATALASDVSLLEGIPGVDLALDARGLTELGSFGHPVEGRTLFRDVKMAPAGAKLTLKANGELIVGAEWQLPDADPLPWSEFVEAQIEAFVAATRATDVSGSFLSLTAGLDTRTVLAALASERRLVPGVTMTGRQPSLDSRTARRLCDAYGIQHEPIVLDTAFRAALPALVVRASRLAGGLASLSQAPEVFLYDQLGSRFTSRVSGNLGNQVGRGGTEGVSLRGAELAILAPAMRVDSDGGSHWLLRNLGKHPRAALEFILKSEIAYSSVGNYTVGNHFAVQQSPYASRSLIELLARRPASGSLPSGSRLRMRLRDLRHRYLGEPERVSFQRTLVRRLDGPAAHVPVNWGWRPAGLVSPTGLALGALTMAGMVARAKGLDDGAMGALVRRTGIPALHDFRESRRWLRDDLRTFVLDTMSSVAVRDSGLFDQRKLSAVMADHFGGHRDHYETVTFALDVALADGLRRAPAP
jgi:hypothetical protein